MDPKPTAGAPGEMSPVTEGDGERGGKSSGIWVQPAAWGGREGRASVCPSVSGKALEQTTMH